MLNVDKVTQIVAGYFIQSALLHESSPGHSRFRTFLFLSHDLDGIIPYVQFLGFMNLLIKVFK